MSHFLVKREHLSDSSSCSLGGAYHQASVQENGGTHWLPCINTWTIQLYDSGKQINTGHCLYNTMAKYRWVIFYDIDEWLVSKVRSAAGYTELLKHIRAKPAGLVNRDFGQDNASWPVSFM